MDETPTEPVVAVVVDWSSEPIAWDDPTRLAAGQCLVAESGWRNRTEHSAILHVLERRWRRFNTAVVRWNASHRRSEPRQTISFVEQVRRYCHVHRVPREDSANGWALSLPWGPLVEDPGIGAGWDRYVDDWEYAARTVLMFEGGELPDPMPLAIIFGGAMDSVGPDVTYLGPWTTDIAPSQHGYQHRRVLLHNRFYTLRSTLGREIARRERLTPASRR